MKKWDDALYLRQHLSTIYPDRYVVDVSRRHWLIEYSETDIVRKVYSTEHLAKFTVVVSRCSDRLIMWITSSHKQITMETYRSSVFYKHSLLFSININEDS